MTVTRDEFERLKSKVAEHEARLKDAVPVVAEHEDRLDSHDVAIQSFERTQKHLAADVASVKTDLRALTGGVDRAINAVTSLLSSSEHAARVLSKVANQVDALHTKLEAARG